MRSSSRFPIWPTTTLVIAVLATIIALPDSLKPWAPAFLKPPAHLGLDLAGGTQLDFRISEKEIGERKAQVQADIDKLKDQQNTGTAIIQKQNELAALDKQQQSLVEAIRNVLERRINSLGVSEATITPSFFGDEKHLLVECPGIIDVQKCAQTVGKTIQLEFKEEFSGQNTAYEGKIRNQASSVFATVTSGTGSLEKVGQDLSTQLGVSYIDARPFFQSELTGGLETLWNGKKGDPPVKIEGSTKTVRQNAQGQSQLVDVKGIYIAQVIGDKTETGRTLADPSQALSVLNKRMAGSTLIEQKSVAVDAQRSEIRSPLSTLELGKMQAIDVGGGQAGVLYVSGRIEGVEQMSLSHLLVAYKGAERADAGVTRTKAQALTRIKQLQERLKNGENFTTLVKRESDGPSKAKGGSLGVVKKGMMFASFEQAAFALKAKGEMSDIVESPAGYHIIRVDAPVTTTTPTASYTYLVFKESGAMAKAQSIIKDIENKKVTNTEPYLPIRLLFFSLEPTGWKDTALNGERFRSASVTVNQVNTPVVQILFDEQGGKLFQELTKRNVGKRIAIFVGGDLVSAPYVQNEISGGSAIITGSRTFEEAQNLAQDLNTGAIPAPIFLSGQSTIEATLGTTALTQSVNAALVGLLIIAALMVLIYRGLGLMADIALFTYVSLLIAAMKLPILLVSNQYVVLSLAGIAGIILSMGMAVDANILVFERLKEEVAKGKHIKTAVETGFKRAWPSIRDGNASTLITSAILFTIGTSIIRGFSVTLVIGVLLSLFTAMVITGWLVRWLAASPFGKRPEIMGVKPPAE